MMDITPEDFTGRVAGHVTAADPFDRFVETCQFATRASYVSHGYTFQYPLIALATEANVWFMPSRPGPLEDLLDLVRDEAEARHADRFFVAVRTKVGWNHGADPIETDVNVPDDNPLVVPGLYCFAASKVGSYYQRRVTLARFTEFDLSPFVDAPDVQEVPMFDKVLA